MILRPLDEGPFPIFWGDDRHVRLTLRDDNDLWTPLTLEGLISDGALLFLDAPSLELSLQTSPAQLDRLRNLHPDPDGITVDLVTSAASLTLRAELSVEFPVGVSFAGNMQVAKDVAGNGDTVVFETAPATITAVILALVSTWTEYQMTDLTDMLLQDMIYTEVG